MTGFGTGTATDTALSKYGTVVPSSGAEFSYADSPNLDAFGRLRVSHPLTIFDSKQIYDNQPLLWDDAEVSGGSTTSTHDADRASTVIGVALNTAGNRIRQSFMRFNYQPGKSQLIFLTGILDASGGGTGITRSVGYFDDDNGLFFKDDEGTVKVVRRTNVTGTPVDNEVAQTNWNIDKMDGSGPSGVTVDWTKTQIFVVDFEWLGVGRARMAMVIDGVIYPVHAFNNANVLDAVYMSTPNLPLRYEITNDGTGAASTLEQVCSSVISEGGVDDLGSLRYNSTAGTLIEANAAGTIYAVCGLRLKAATLGARVQVQGITMYEGGAVDYEWLLIMNPTVANAVTFNDETNSNLQFAVGNAGNPSNSTLTGGTVIDGGYIGNTNQVAASASAVPHNAILLGADISGTRDELYLAVRPLAANANVFGGIQWRETP